MQLVFRPFMTADVAMRYFDTSLINWRYESIIAIEAAKQLTGSRPSPDP
jgi:hypothetical protein